jgi:hypothetical protein
MRISHMGIIESPEPNSKGVTPFAYFTLEHAGISLRGCCLVATGSGQVNVWPPRVADLDRSRGVVLVDPEVKAQIVELGLRAFAGLGGDLGAVMASRPAALG